MGHLDDLAQAAAGSRPGVRVTRNAAAPWLALLVILSVGGGAVGVAWHHHEQQQRIATMSDYEARAANLAAAQQLRGLSREEAAELAELNRRIGEFRADGVGR